MAKVAPLKGYVGLDNRGDVPRVSQNLRVRFTIYPQAMDFEGLALNAAGGNALAKRTSAKKMVLDWTSQSQMGLQLFDFHKQMGQPSGVWSAIAKEKRGIELGLEDGQILDGDWCDVSILRNGVEIPLCRGVIDSCREQTMSSGGSTVRTWSLSGRDHGSFFEYPITYSNIWAQTLGELTQGLFTARVKGKIGGRPDELFRILVEATFASGKLSGQWELPQSLADTTGGQKRLHDLLDIVTYSADKTLRQGLRGAYYNEPALWTAGGQTLHQTLEQWCNPLMNEMYYDLIPPTGFTPQNGQGQWIIPLPTDTDVEVKERVDNLGGVLKPGGAELDSLLGEFGVISAIIRERPFPSTVMGRDSLWFDLPEWRLPMWALQSLDLGRAGHERYNLFELLTDLSMGSTAEQPPQARPTWNKMDIRQRGLRTFSQTTRYLAQLKSGLGDWFAERSTWQALIRDWYAPSPYLRQGQVVSKLFLPEVRIGQKLVLDEGGAESDNERLYIEGTHLRYTGPAGPSKPPGGMTTFTLSHGFRGTDKQHLDAVKSLASFFEEVF